MQKHEPLDGLTGRISNLSRRKSHLELINRMLIRLTEVSGLDNMVRHILSILMETIGASNLAIYYLLDGSFRYADIMGESRVVDVLDDARVTETMTSLVPLRIDLDVSGSVPSALPCGNVPQDWYFPLIARGRAIGAVVMKEMQLTDEGIWREISPFFTYAGLMLDNELTNYAHLAEAHRKLQDSETLYRTLLEQSPDGILLTDPLSTKPVYFNSAAHRQLGYTKEEFAELTIGDIEAVDGKEDIGRRIKALFETGSDAFESVYRTKQGGLRDTHVSLRTVRVSGRLMILAIVKDITERKRLEAERLEMERQLLHSQKLESLGVLAGGIAHDFNNLLAAIMGNLDLGLLTIQHERPERARIEQALEACDRAADLIRQMLAYSGKGAFEKKEIDINQVVQHNAELLRVSIPRTISILIDVLPGLPPVVADPGQVQQVVMNLITNAAEAIGHAAGVITISTGVDVFGADYLAGSRLEDKPAPGRFVWLQVADTGSGMDEKTLGRLFEPFFTTKFTGRGLGMSAVLGIVRSNGGAIIVESSMGKGAHFRVLFPASDSPAGDAPLDAAAPVAVVRTKGTILVADDEVQVRDFCCTCIEALGYKALPAADGREALRLYREQEADIDLVLLDLTMPHMGGAATFEELKKVNPDVKVIVTSGYGEQNVAAEFLSGRPAGFIQKPFLVKSLHELITAVIGDSAD